MFDPVSSSKALNPRVPFSLFRPSAATSRPAAATCSSSSTSPAAVALADSSGSQLPSSAATSRDCLCRLPPTSSHRHTPVAVAADRINPINRKTLLHRRPSTHPCHIHSVDDPSPPQRPVRRRSASVPPLCLRILSVQRREQMVMAAPETTLAAEEKTKKINKDNAQNKRKESPNKAANPEEAAMQEKEKQNEAANPEEAAMQEKEEQKQKHQHQQLSTGRKKRKETFIYGNYKYYYGYRHDQTSKEDPRLGVFKKEWFEGKDCLDIGCNQGLVTIDIARKFQCRSILGVDIDKNLIEAAFWNLRKVAGKGRDSCKSDEGSKTQMLTKEFQSSSPEDIFSRVSFIQENFVHNSHGCSEKYDAVTCLSVTKWIHLNWGDDGLINMFIKIWKLLRPGGILILEPQPWSSYGKNYKVSEIAKENFRNILLRPHRFQEILLDKIGFRSSDVITDSLCGTTMGFDRPILTFLK